MDGKLNTQLLGSEQQNQARTSILCLPMCRHNQETSHGNANGNSKDPSIYGMHVNKTDSILK